jgi:hypothetical protein
MRVLARSSHNASASHQPAEKALGQPADARVIRVAEAIRRYLSQHPDAADCENGIAAWWMPAVGVETSVAEVSAALAHLEQKGYLERRALPDGRLIYRRRHPES